MSAPNKSFGLRMRTPLYERLNKVIEKQNASGGRRVFRNRVIVEAIENYVTAFERKECKQESASSKSQSENPRAA